MAASHKQDGREEKKEPPNVTKEETKPLAKQQFKGGAQATSILYVVCN